MRIELTQALHALRVDRATSVVALVILTLAIAAATLTFAVADAVALRPLPYGSPERLVGISAKSRTSDLPALASPRDYFDWLAADATLESVGAARMTSNQEVVVSGTTVRLTARSVTGNLFSVLAVGPFLGRLVFAESGDPGSSVILSFKAWAKTFGGDPDIVGRTITIGGVSRVIAGVLPEGVDFPMTAGPPPDLYLPYVATASDRTDGRGFSMFVVGRLRSGVSMEQARADITRVSRGPVVVQSLMDRVVGAARTPAVLILAAVGLVVLVACANVSNLRLARAVARGPELATREALGAPRSSLVGGLLLEALILSAIATAAGLLISAVGLAAVKTMLPTGLARASSIALDGRVMLAASVIAVLAGLVSASGPAWLVSRADLVNTIRGSTSQLAGSRVSRRVLASFLVADLAFATMVLVAATLVVMTFVQVMTVDLGFDRAKVVSVAYRASLASTDRLDRPAAAAALRRRLLDAARAVPEVEDVALVAGSSAPLTGGSVRYGIGIPGVGEVDREDWLETRMVTPDYFQATGMRLLKGRLISADDVAGAPRVMLINDVAAARFFPGRDAIGQTVLFRGPTTIVGILKGVHFDGPESPVRPEMYVPAAQEPPDYQTGSLTFGALVVRSSRNARAAAEKVRQAVQQEVPGLESELEASDDGFRAVTARRRFSVQLMTGFGLLALLIGALGVYGTTSFVVNQTRVALAVRMALGASPGGVRLMVVGDALRLVILGTGLGLGGAWLSSHLLGAFLFGVRPAEPMAYAAVLGLLSAVGIAAAVPPAIRASRSDPLSLLKSP
jgi:putative ABC transport system permease protein